MLITKGGKCPIHHLYLHSFYYSYDLIPVIGIALNRRQSLRVYFCTHKSEEAHTHKKMSLKFQCVCQKHFALIFWNLNFRFYADGLGWIVTRPPTNNHNEPGNVSNALLLYIILIISKKKRHIFVVYSHRLWKHSNISEFNQSKSPYCSISHCSGSRSDGCLRCSGSWWLSLFF